MARLFDTPTPRVFNIPPSTDFLFAVVDTLRIELESDRNPDALTNCLILVPTRRAAKALGDAFAHRAGTGVALLPMIRPLGDIDVDDPPFEPGELAGIAPPAVSRTRRLFELSRLILAKETALGRPIGTPGAMALARTLAELLDDLADESVTSLEPLQAALSDHLPEDRREAIEFLSIVEQIWPARLEELGLSDPSARRSLVLNALADRWLKHPPETPVLVLGSTGSIPAVRRLMGVVSRLPQGAVVLPGLDWDADDHAWDSLDDGHPQWAMRDFLTENETSRGDVQPWPGHAEPGNVRARRRLVAEALRPAEVTDEWLARVGHLRQANGESFFDQALDGLSLVECPDPLNEAKLCALLFREVLDAEGKTAILVTPDRSLARRVSVEMQRFGVRVDDSGGTALPETLAGAFLDRLLDITDDPGSVVAQTALWSSPLYAMGQARGELHSALQKFEADGLRGVRPGSDLGAIIARLDHERSELFDADRELIRRVLTLQDAAQAGMQACARRSVADWARHHAILAEAVARDVDQDGALRLWRSEGGEIAARVLSELMTESEVLPELTLAEYTGVFRELCSAQRIPPATGVHPRLQILGPMEARLASADRVILAGLNEGIWPSGAGADPWMSRGMRQEVGMGAAEKRYGLAAHDFAQLAAAGEVFMTRATRVDGAPTVASRWIWRLKTLVRGALGTEGDERLTDAGRYVDYAAALDRSDADPRPATPPAPAPPVSARPRGLSITEIRTWVRDPYAIYARHVLGLRPLDPPDMAPGPRERGTALHAVLETAMENWRTALPDDAVAQLLDLAGQEFQAAGIGEQALEVELRRFARAAEWIVQWEKQRRAEGYSIAAIESRGRIKLDAPAGEWTLRGRADRIDRRPDGTLDVIDYKSGNPPTAKMVHAGFDPQLPLTAAIIEEAGGFDGLGQDMVSALSYVKISGGSEAGKATRINGKTPASELASQALDDLRDWIARFDDEAEAYLSQPRRQYRNDYGDYDHLARRGEWAIAPGEEGGEG